MSTGTARGAAWFSVAIAALGYLVDLYDIVIFGVVRVSSLAELGYTGAEGTAWGVRLLNLQMAGMLIGGFAWGWIGDRFGRRAALLGCIAVFSLANLANAAVGDVHSYLVLRFIAGFGLAGELGAGVTLVSELLPRERRGYGATLVMFLGFCGASLAALVGSWLPWRMAFLIGGVLGLLVLAGRWAGLRESPMFAGAARAPALQTLRLWTGSASRLARFAAVVLLGVPVWFTSALLVNLAPEYGHALGLSDPLAVGRVLLFQSLGLALGSAAWGLLGEHWKSRRKTLAAALALLLAASLLLLHGLDGASAHHYSLLMLAIGALQGYWTVYLSLIAEQFGSNLRATVTTAVPNLVRASTIPVTLGVLALQPPLGLVGATLLVGLPVYALAALSLLFLRESWGRSLDYAER